MWAVLFGVSCFLVFVGVGGVGGGGSRSFSKGLTYMLGPHAS